MKTKLDETLEGMLQQVPEWRSRLSSEEAYLVQRRLDGATLQELADEVKLTRAGIRYRLYGSGHGRLRSGGVLGRLRGLRRQHSQEE